MITDAKWISQPVDIGEVCPIFSKNVSLEKPVKVFTTPKGERVIDFGQNIAGYVSFEVTASKGDKIVIFHAEVLDSEGNLYTENYRSTKAKLKYICRDGRQKYKPFFTFYGFRYIRLDEYPDEVNPYDFTAIAIYSGTRNCIKIL